MPAQPDSKMNLRIFWRSAYGLSLWIANTAIFALLLTPFIWLGILTVDKTGRWPRRILRAMCRVSVRRFCGSNLRIGDFDWSAIQGPCILVANHQSLIDILLLMLLPTDARCWAKRWPFRVPFLGLMMRLCGHLCVEDPRVLYKAAESLRDGVSLLVFPEGTRSRDGKLTRFHDGAFLLSARTGVPVVPVLIRGSGTTMPPGTFRLVDSPLVIRPLGVLYPDASLDKPHLDLKRRAVNMIALALESSDEENTQSGPRTQPSAISEFKEAAC